MDIQTKAENVRKYKGKNGKEEKQKNEKKYWTSAFKSCILNSGHFGEVPKLAEGAPLEREQVVNSGAWVQIPSSPLGILVKTNDTEINTNEVP